MSTKISSQSFDAPNIDLEKTEEEAYIGFGDRSQFGRLVGLRRSRGFDAENVDTEGVGEEGSISFGDMGLQFVEPISLGPYRSFDAENPDIYEWISEYIDQNLVIDESICSIYNTIARRCSFVLRQISSVVVYNDKKIESLFLKLNDLLAEMEAVAGEVCPHHVADVQNLARLIAGRAPALERSKSREGARQTITSAIPPAPEAITKREGLVNAEAAIARGRASHAEKKPVELPALPEGLAWPTETYAEAHNRTGERIVEFLERVWKPLIDAGFGELRWLRMVDLSAAQGVENYERVDPKTGEKRRLPQRLRLLTKKEANDLKLAGVLSAIRDDPKLAGTLATRLRRRAATPNA